jgi:hypothetical protein
MLGGEAHKAENVRFATIWDSPKHRMLPALKNQLLRGNLISSRFLSSIRVLSFSTAASVLFVSTPLNSSPTRKMTSNRAAWLIAEESAPLEIRSAPYTLLGENEIVVKNAALAINSID